MKLTLLNLFRPAPKPAAPKATPYDPTREGWRRIDIENPRIRYRLVVPMDRQPTQGPAITARRFYGGE